MRDFPEVSEVSVLGPLMVKKPFNYPPWCEDLFCT